MAEVLAQVPESPVGGVHQYQGVRICDNANGIIRVSKVIHTNNRNRPPSSRGTGPDDSCLRNVRASAGVPQVLWRRRAALDFCITAELIWSE
jgi:hypothetical protein